MPVEYTGFLLMPVGFFDRNPALDVPPTSGSAAATPTADASIPPEHPAGVRRMWGCTDGCSAGERQPRSTVPAVDDTTGPIERGEAESRDVAELLAVLDLEELDRDIFRGVNPAGDDRRPRLFGGQVAAQAARAASLTVPDDRSIHSLHGYFLRGRARRPPDDPARRP